MSRRPACSGSAGRRAAPGVVGPAATTSARPARPHPAGVEQQVHGGEQRSGARLVRAPHVGWGEDDRGPAGRLRRGLGAEHERGGRVLGGQRRARGGGGHRGRGAGDRGCRCLRGVRRAGEQGVGEHGEQRRRPDGDRHRTGRPRVPVHGGGVQHHRPGTGVGDIGERRFVEHSPAGPGGGIEYRRAEGLGDDRRPRRRRPAGRGRRAARGPARRGRRRRTAVRRRSRRARPPPACPARCPRRRRRCRAPSRSGRAPRSPAASPQRSRRGRGRRPGRWPPGRPNPRAPPRRTRRAALRGDRPEPASGPGRRRRAASAHRAPSAAGAGCRPAGRARSGRGDHPAPWARPGRRPGPGLPAATAPAAAGARRPAGRAARRAAPR